MKIAWVTPFCQKSAIGRYSKFAAEALSKLCDVDIVTFHTEDLHETTLKVITFNEKNVMNMLKKYDLAIYNIGDNSEYHASIFDTSLHKRGIFIMHDVSIHNLMRGYYIVYKENPNEYIRLITKVYGEEASAMLLDAANSVEKWNQLDLTQFSMAEVVFSHAYGVVVHSSYHKVKTQQIYDGLLKVIPLVNMSDFPQVSDTAFSGYPQNKLNILTLGNVNYNKRIHSIIEAIASSSILRKNVCYTCIGSLGNTEYKKILLDKIEKHNLSKTVRLLGFVSHEELAKYYHFANVISNLRYPALEGGSASLQEQMLMGKSILVSNTGVYAEMPDDCVFKIDPSNEIGELIVILEKLVKNPSLLRTYGENAEIFAEELFSREAYAKNLYDFIRHVQFTLPLHSLINQVSTECIHMGVSSDMQLHKTVAMEMDMLFR